MNKTISYYDTNAKEYSDDTFLVDLKNTQNHFLNLLPKYAYILDFGCGSGRDTKYFIEQGFKVDAIDGSKELCEIAKNNTGIEIQNMLFQDLNVIHKYDGIWACASILHLPQNELVDVLNRMTNALKENGIIYASFKYGTYEGERNGRYFTDFTEETFLELLEQIPELKIKEQWLSGDVRENRGEEQWLNLILGR